MDGVLPVLLVPNTIHDATAETHVSQSAGHVYRPFILRSTQEILNRHVAKEKQTKRNARKGTTEE